MSLKNFHIAGEVGSWSVSDFSSLLAGRNFQNASGAHWGTVTVRELSLSRGRLNMSYGDWMVSDMDAGPSAREDEFKRYLESYMEDMIGRLGKHGTSDPEEIRDLYQRLENANSHFRRKAAAVLGDDDAIWLLSTLYQTSSIEIVEVDTLKYGIALAKLTAANFCEVGANVIYITEAGQNFIESIRDA